MARNRAKLPVDPATGNLANLWINAGGDPAAANIMAAIAMAESSGNAGIIQSGQPYATTGWGLWQITPGDSVPSVGTDYQLLDPLTNAKAAIVKYNNAVSQFGYGEAPWTTYTSGAYLAFLPNASQQQYYGGQVSAGGQTGSGGKVGTSTARSRPGGQQKGQPPSDIVAALMTAQQESTAYGTTGASTTTQTTGFLSGLPIVGGFLNDVANTVDSLDPLHLYSGVSGAINSVTDALKFFAWISNPINWLRAIEFLFGLGMMAFGIQAAMQARGERLEGFQTGESALSRSGLGRVSREVAAAARKAAAPEASAASSASRRIRPATAPHKTRRTALRVRYEREQQVARRNTERRRGG